MSELTPLQLHVLADNINTQVKREIDSFILLYKAFYYSSCQANIPFDNLRHNADTFLHKAIIDLISNPCNYIEAKMYIEYLRDSLESNQKKIEANHSLYPPSQLDFLDQHKNQTITIDSNGKYKVVTNNDKLLSDFIKEHKGQTIMFSNDENSPPPGYRILSYNTIIDPDAYRNTTVAIDSDGNFSLLPSYFAKPLSDSTPKLDLPVPVVRYSKVNTAWLNFADFCSSIKRSLPSVASSILPNCVLGDDNVLVIPGRYKTPFFQELQEKYLHSYVMCPSCQKIDTTENEGVIVCPSCTS